MGKPRYMFRPCKGPGDIVVVHMDLLSEPPPTPEKFQRKARLRRLKQALLYSISISSDEYQDAVARVEADYAEKP